MVRFVNEDFYVVGGIFGCYGNIFVGGVVRDRLYGIYVVCVFVFGARYLYLMK